MPSSIPIRPDTSAPPRRHIASFSAPPAQAGPYIASDENDRQTFGNTAAEMQPPVCSEAYEHRLSPDSLTSARTVGQPADHSPSLHISALETTHVDPASSHPRSRLQRHSSLGASRDIPGVIEVGIQHRPGLMTSRSAPQIRQSPTRPAGYLDARGCPTVALDGYTSDGPLPVLDEDNGPWRPSTQWHSNGRPCVLMTEVTVPPRASLQRLTSLDNYIAWREELAEWKRTSSIMQDHMSDVGPKHWDDQQSCDGYDSFRHYPSSETLDSKHARIISKSDTLPTTQPHGKFRHVVAEIGFCFTIAMTQFLSEFLISGFAIELPRLLNSASSTGTGSLGLFWPASLLSLILSATLLIFARVSDMYGGYLPFMFGVTWLSIWTLIPGLVSSETVLSISRAMQGVALAALMPSTFAMVGSIYAEGPRKNTVMGFYCGCGPLGLCAGLLTAAALPDDKSEWYSWIASIISVTTTITAYLTVPHDRTDRRQLGLTMDWLGAFLITAGLVLVSYALAVEPYANNLGSTSTGFGYPIVYGPLIAGFACLCFAVYVEGWLSSCPLLPLDFFRPKSVKAFCLAGLFFYASFGVWLYLSVDYLTSPTHTTASNDLHGVELAVWYTPTAIGGLLLSVIGGALLHIVPIKLLLLLSGLAWIAAPLLLALAPLPLNYWEYVMPSMLCATLGVDLTYTVSIVFFPAVQPLRYQGLSGAVCSILINLAMSFSLSISAIVLKQTETKLESSGESLDDVTHGGYRAAFLYAACSAGLGFLISICFVRISRSVVGRQDATTEEKKATNSSNTPT